MSEMTDEERAKNAISIKNSLPDAFTPDVQKYLKQQKNLDRSSEQGFVNQETGASIALRSDGSIGLAASERAQIHLSVNGQNVEVALESRTITNRKIFEIDDLVINKHKLNPFLYETADLKQVLRDPVTAVGGFAMQGTVMVKAWEPDLKRYVMIRRPVRPTMFGPSLNLPEIPKGLNIADPTNKTKNLTVDVPEIAATAKTTAAATLPAGSAKTAVPAATTQAAVAPTPKQTTTDGGWAEGSTWGSSVNERPPEDIPSYLEWHRNGESGFILVRRYGC